MRRRSRAWSIGVATAVAVLLPIVAAAQSPSPAPRQSQQQTPPPGGRGRPGGGGRAALPPMTPNMTPQQLQAWIDTYAVVQAERELQLTAEQYPNFVARLRKLQDLRRRHQGERRRLLNELSGLLQGGEGGKDEAITTHVKALDDLNQRAGGDLRQAYQDLDAVLTPWQRGRFRMFEEQLERRKVDLLSKINGNPGGAEKDK
jgi:hypothetical protein